MHADFSVELGREDPALELPWSSPDPHVRYFDLKSHPELVQQIPEAVAHPELCSLLSRINTAGFPLATAKCDAWSSSEVDPEEEIFGDHKFVSYIDLVFVNEGDRCSFEKHESFAKELCQLLGRAPEIAATVELVIRRCYYHEQKLVHDRAVEQNDTPLQQSADRRVPALQSAVYAPKDVEHFNASERSDSGAKDLETTGSLNHTHLHENAETETKFQSEDQSQSNDDAQSGEKDRLERNIESKDDVPRADRVESKDDVPMDDTVQPEDNVRTKDNVQLKDTVQSGDKPHWEDASAAITGFCLTTYVTGFGDSDHDPVRRWTIGLSLLQHALVQLNRNE
jgi:hypothetical protein